MKKQTATELLFEKIMDSKHDDDLHKFLAQSKTLERYQLHQAYIAGRKNGQKKSELNFNDFLQIFNTDKP